MISSISCLQDNSSEFIKLNIQHKSRIMSSSNLTVISGISYFSTSSITSYVSNKTNHQKFSNLFIGDKNSQKISSNESCLTVEISDLVIF